MSAPPLPSLSCPGTFEPIVTAAANGSLTTVRRSPRATVGRHPAGRARVEFRILGSTEVLDEGRRVGLPVGRGRALLALLVLYAGEVVAADRLIDELWGESSPPTASTVIQGLISKLRKLLDPLRAKGEPGG